MTDNAKRELPHHDLVVKSRKFGISDIENPNLVGKNGISFLNDFGIEMLRIESVYPK